MSEGEACELLPGPDALEEAIRSNDRLFVLFYAEWCPFSRAFLPEFVDRAERGARCFRRILSDDNDPHVRKYRIEVYPTVLFFEHGQLARRLDGRYLKGLDRPGLEKFIEQCGGG